MLRLFCADRVTVLITGVEGIPEVILEIDPRVHLPADRGTTRCCQ